MPSATTIKAPSSGTKRKAESTKSGRTKEGKKPKTEDVEQKVSKSKKAPVKAVKESKASSDDDFDAMDEDGGALVDGEAEDVEMGDAEAPLAGLHPDRMKAVANGM